MKLEAIRCKECGDKVCICSCENGHWGAHCMTCDNWIGCGFLDNFAPTQQEATRLWNELNMKEQKTNGMNGL